MASSLSELLKDDVSLEEVQELVQTGEVDVKETDCDGNNILHKVCSLNTEKSDIVEYLISVGAAVNQVNVEGCTALIVCASKGYLDTLRVLLNHGAFVDFVGLIAHSDNYDPYIRKSRGSALLTAAENGHEKCVSELIKHGADIWNQNNNRQNLLMLACSKGLAGVVRYCVDHGTEDQINKTCRRQTALLLAYQNDHVECVRILLSRIKYPSRDRWSEANGYYYESPILTAANKKHKKWVLELLSQGADISSKTSENKNLLMFASENGWVSIVRECLKYEREMSEVDGNGKTALMYACENKQYECLEELLTAKQHSATIDKVSKLGLTALMICAQEGFEDGLNLLIKFKADINPNFSVCAPSYLNGIYEERTTTLLLAAKSKHEECVKILIDHGADIWCKNNKGQNLLMVACEQGLLDTVKYCLAHGSFSQITDPDIEGYNALYHAYKSNQIKCMKELLERGSQSGWNNDLMVHKTTQSLETLLHLTFRNEIERPDIMELLISYTNVVDSVDKNGCTPLMLCAQHGFLESSKVLLKNGASVNIVQSPNILDKRQLSATAVAERILLSGLDPTARDTALLMAAKAKCQELTLELIDNGADIWYVNKYGNSLLDVACSNGLIKVVKKVLSRNQSGGRFEKEIDNDIRMEDLCKALHAAIRGKHEECALLIIGHGADVWYTDGTNGKNALMLAAESDLPNVVKICVSKGSSDQFNRRDNSGNVASILAIQTANYHCAREIPKCETLTPGDIETLNWRLHDSLKEKNHDEIEVLVSHGASVNSQFYGQTPLIDCLQNGHLENLKILIGLGADVNATSDIWKSPLFAAVNRGHEKCALELISHGADIAGKNTQDQTVLMLAAQKGLLNLVKKCLEECSESHVNMVDRQGKNAVAYACERRQTACLEEILMNPKCSLGECEHIYVNSYPAEKELLALYRSGVKVLSDNKKERDMLFALDEFRLEQEFLDRIASGVDIWYRDSKGQNLLMKAAHRHLVSIVKYCVAKATFEQICETDREGNTALMLACSNLPQDCSRKRYLLECLEEIFKHFTSKDVGSTKFVNISAKDYNNNKSLIEIVCNSDWDKSDLVKLLIDKGTSVNEFNNDGFTPLMLCSKKGHSRSLSVLLEAGADINETNKLMGDSNKETVTVEDKPTHVFGGFMLLQHPERKESKVDSEGNSALLLAAIHSYESCVFRLISHGSDIWTSNSKGENLLMLASAKGLWNVVQYCLDHGSVDQINRVDIGGNNAVIHACQNSQVNTLNTLLNCTNCFSQVNTLSEELDMTPLMLAVCNNSMDVATVLLKNGANPNQENREGLTSLMIALGKVPTQQSHVKDDNYSGSTSGKSEGFPKLLIRHGASVTDVCKQTEENLLILATAYEHSDKLIVELLAQGLNVNHIDKNGNTALGYACIRHRLNIVRHFLRHGASLAHTRTETDIPLIRKYGDSVFKLLVIAGLQTEKLNNFPKAKDGVVPNLYDLCRIPARQHVMNSFPNTNLFFTIPRLVLPRKMKDFLLYNCDIDSKIDTIHIHGLDVDEGRIFF